MTRPSTKPEDACLCGFRAPADPKGQTCPTCNTVMFLVGSDHDFTTKGETK